jgi:hypothetical protein
MPNTQETVVEKIDSLFDSIGDYLLDIEDNLVGSIQDFMEGLQRPDGSPNVELTEAEALSQSAGFYEQQHRYLGDQAQAKANAARADGNNDLADSWQRSADQNYDIADSRLSVGDDYHWLSQVSENANKAAKYFGVIGDVVDIGQLATHLASGDWQDATKKMATIAGGMILTAAAVAVTVFVAPLLGAGVIVTSVSAAILGALAGWGGRQANRLSF